MALSGRFLFFRNDSGEHIRADFKLITALLEGDAEDILVLDFVQDIVRVNFNDIVAALAFCSENFNSLCV